jgi:hypothetical protein
VTRHWINTVSREHVLRGVRGGFTQADHGTDTRLRRLRPGDRLAFYSPRTEMRVGEPLQQLTAIGTVTGEEPYQVEVSPTFRPWRLSVAFDDVEPVPIRPLLERLEFVTDKQRCGMPFRRGLFEVGEADMAVVEEAFRLRRASGSPAHAAPSR